MPARLVLVGLLLAIAGGCSRNGDFYRGDAKLYSLTGTVKLDGAPVDGGTITFQPLSPDARAVTCEIVEGEYFISAENGAEAGAYRVEIRRPRDEDPAGSPVGSAAKTIPAKYNDNSQLTAEVSGN